MTSAASAAPPRKVLVVSDGKHGPTATQRISFGQPFETDGKGTSLRFIFQKQEVSSAAIERAFTVQNPDVLVLSRYTSELGSDWIRLARAAAIPVIYHIDDDLLAVPPSLGKAKYGTYNEPQRLKALRANIENSDLLYVSTPALADRLVAHGIQTPVFAGEIYCSVNSAELGSSFLPATGPVIGYMGTSGHSENFRTVIPALCDVMDAVPSLRFELFGTIALPPELKQFGGRVRHLPPVRDYSQFNSYLKTLGWWIGLAPLEDNMFNRCKADTKWVEYSLAGMAVVASDLPIYCRACGGNAGIVAKSGSDWSSAMLMLLAHSRQRSELVSNAQAKLRGRYTHEHLRRQFEAVIAKAFEIASS
jgi:glycosyltransferase involved in cell wall biosynthesis